MPALANNATVRIDRILGQESPGRDIYKRQFYTEYALRNTSGAQIRWSGSWVSVPHGYVYEVDLLSTGGTVLGNNATADLKPLDEHYEAEFIVGVQLKNSTGASIDWEYHQNDINHGYRSQVRIIP